jgi:hypothetical protein
LEKVSNPESNFRTARGQEWPEELDHSKALG